MEKNEKPVVSNLVLRNAMLIWRNFEGREGPYNDEGDRNFCIKLPHDLAETLKDDGWHIKMRPPRDSQDEMLYYLPVKVQYEYYPPSIYIVKYDGSLILLEEKNLKDIDYAEIENVDCTIRPYVWTKNNGGFGIKAYLKNMYITLVKDELAIEYSNTGINDNAPF